MRAKMSIENRAKQFMPFSALPGLEDALAATEAEAEAASSGLSPSSAEPDSGCVSAGDIRLSHKSPGDSAPGPQ